LLKIINSSLAAPRRNEKRWMDIEGKCI